MSNYLGSINVFNHNEQEWSVFYGKLKQFLKLNDVKEDKKGPLLLTHLSDDTYRLLQNLIHPKNLEEASYADILAVLSEHLTPKRCTFADRERFCEAKRATGESVEEWAARIRGLAVHCDFGSSLEMLLTNRFVLGMSVGPERDRLFEQDAATLTFAKALEIAQQTSCMREARAAAAGAPLHMKEEPVYHVTGGSGRRAGAAGPRACSASGASAGARDQYSRNFIPNASSLMSPLHELLRAKAEWVWGARQRDAMRAVKRELVSERVSAHFEPTDGAADLQYENNCLLRGPKVIIPESLRGGMLAELHKSHLGIVKMKSNARSRMWWPGIDSDIERHVSACSARAAAALAAPARSLAAPVDQNDTLSVLDGPSKESQDHPSPSTVSTPSLSEPLSDEGSVETRTNDDDKEEWMDCGEMVDAESSDDLLAPAPPSEATHSNMGEGSSQEAQPLTRQLRPRTKVDFKKYF
ncbi:uncharacterized protein LOC113232139 [Hyposmocoma kahamanoa]|uniref:uncharacterized protein LOC113232139 n=1 Tax=Hyposmocoma kahamanoa TaxID=1477025 RepID=UPI000E6D7D29|nr:uncharacterized protein LOC113232139 [Hyposmocoma kahamanoa]